MIYEVLLRLYRQKLIYFFQVRQTIVTPEKIYKIHEMILDDLGIKVREVAEAVGMSTERVQSILHEYLDMKSYPRERCRDCSHSIISGTL